VAPAAGGPLDLVQDGITGFLVTPGDPGAPAAVARLAASPELRAAQGRAGRPAVLGRGWPARCGELLGRCRAVLDAAEAVRADVPA
jgi:phosphatidylinositol alpha 1,6-mannosyltransferase